jgi:hypothetical protein
MIDPEALNLVPLFTLQQNPPPNGIERKWKLKKTSNNDDNDDWSLAFVV